LKHEYIEKDLVRFEHHSFPLDLAALNAEIIVRCHVDREKNFQLLGEIYKKQDKWAVGSDINIINEFIKKIGLDLGLDSDKMDDCLKNEKVQDQILNERIEAQRKYKIQSTPTIFINDKQYKGEHKYKLFRKQIEKILKKYEI
jgi:protein-disulfide isomerase